MKRKAITKDEIGKSLMSKRATLKNSTLIDNERELREVKNEQ